MQVIKKDSRTEEFDVGKIFNAVYKATEEIYPKDVNRCEIYASRIAVAMILAVKSKDQDITVNQIHNMVEDLLMKKDTKVAKAYIIYREHRRAVRESECDLMDSIEEVSREISRENANTEPSSASKMYQIASLSNKKFALTRLIKPQHAKAHLEGDIHIHDLDYYQHTINCMTHDLARMLSEGFNNGVGYIRPPKRIGSATALTAIILQSTQNQMFGGQAIDFLDKALAKYAEAEYRKQLNLVYSLCVGHETEDYCKGRAMELTENSVYQAMEALVYNLNTMRARSGNQVPFTSFNFGTDTSLWGRMVTRNLLLAFKKGLGKGESPLFPNLCFRVKKGINYYENDPNYDLFLLALECASVRMNPTFAFMDSSFNKEYGDEVGYMGCRTRVINDIYGDSVITGRGNLFFTTINLPRIAIKSKNYNDFTKNLKEVVDLTINQLLERYEVCKKLKVKDMPFIMSGYYVGSEGLKPNDSIESAIKHGTLSLGFIGLAECLIKLIGSHHGETAEARRIGFDIVNYLRTRMDEATEEYKLNFTLLATPAEGLSGRFVKMDREKYGVIYKVTDKDYYTNSFHVPVSYECDISHKINTEAPYHRLCNAGHISYVEVPESLKHNITGLETIVKYMEISDMGYVGINFPIDFCKKCSYLGTIEKECPKCGCEDIKRIRRITGYMSEQDKFNDAKRAELEDRVSHGGRKKLG